jgi:hypothetical protein
MPAMKPRAAAKIDSDEQRRLAVLIDADNARPSVIEGLLAEIAKFGVASVKRIYGDWTSTQHGQWKKALLAHSLSPVQQFAYTTGKNATDATLIIDAMDLMYTRRFDGFCLVSSDSDFTRLAQRLREEGLLVLGFGEKKTPQSFVAACDKFVYTEVLRAEQAAKTAAGPGTTAAAPKPKSKPGVPGSSTTAEGRPKAAAEAPIELIAQAIEEASDDAGWAPLGAVGNYLTKVRPDFDPRLYGHRKLSDLLRKNPRHFVLEERSVPGIAGKTLYVRMQGGEKGS